jgi:hypothetical protein
MQLCASIFPSGEVALSAPRCLAIETPMPFDAPVTRSDLIREFASAVRTEDFGIANFELLT